jgi:hypothetical protein
MTLAPKCLEPESLPTWSKGRKAMLVKYTAAAFVLDTSIPLRLVLRKGFFQFLNILDALTLGSPFGLEILALTISMWMRFSLWPISEASFSRSLFLGYIVGTNTGIGC